MDIKKPERIEVDPRIIGKAGVSLTLATCKTLLTVAEARWLAYQLLELAQLSQACFHLRHSLYRMESVDPSSIEQSVLLFASMSGAGLLE